jgi:hypothetical protein
MRQTVLIFSLLWLAAIAAPAQDWARTKLEKSPRHQEWVELKLELLKGL